MSKSEREKENEGDQENIHNKTQCRPSFCSHWMNGFNDAQLTHCFIVLGCLLTKVSSRLGRILTNVKWPVIIRLTRTFSYGKKNALEITHAILTQNMACFYKNVQVFMATLSP